MALLLWGLFYLKTHQPGLMGDVTDIRASDKVIRLLLDVVFYGLSIVTVFALWVNALLWLINFMIIRHHPDSLDIARDSRNRLTIMVREAFAPLIGVLHAFITTDRQDYIHPVLFLKNKFRLLKPIGTQSTQPLELPHYIPYRFRTVTLQYMDILRMTALPVTISTDYQFHNYPPDRPLPDRIIQPLIHQEDKEALVVPRKKDGDYLHYKHFESGDDVRRIVWKIYAKNKDLIVRIPEREYETANTCYMSYSTVQETPVPDRYSPVALDYLKWSVWNIYQTLRKQNNLLLKKVQGTAPLLPDADIIRNYITDLQWQPASGTHNIDPGNDNIICLHSGMPVETIERLTLRLSPVQTVYFIPLSQAFRVNLVTRGLRKLFFITLHPDPVVQARINFQFSGTRRKWQQKETRILALLQDRNIRYEVVPAQ